MHKFIGVLVLAALPVAAQSSGEFKRWEAYGHVGAGVSYDDEGSIGGGLFTGVGGGKRVTRRIGIEGEYTYFQHDRMIGLGAFRFKGSGHMVTGNFLYHFRPESKVQPFLLVGAGGLSYSDSDGPGFAWTGGVGLKAYVTDHIFLRPEVRLSSGRFDRVPLQPEPPLSNLRFQFGVGYRW